MWLSQLTLSSKYERILEQTTQDNSGYKSKPEVQRPLSRKFTLYIITCSTLFILGTISGVCLSQYSLQQYHGSYEHGFATEISSLYSAIDLVKVQFTGTLKYKEEGHLYIDIGDSIRYFGDPSQEIDDAWDQLIGDLSPVFTGGVIGFGNALRPDVLHTLHCLNEVRMVLDSKHYYNNTLEELARGKRIHIDHCLNHIRQIIQCHMDLTPVGTLYFPNMNTEVGDFDRIHMCRDFSKLQKEIALRSSAKHKLPSSLGKTAGEAKAHRIGYPENEESRLPWDWREDEFN